MLQKLLVRILLGTALTVCSGAAVRAGGGADAATPRETGRTAPDPVVQIGRRTDETAYRITDGQCTIEWVVRDSEKNVILHRPRCPHPLSCQVPLLTKLCSEFFGESGRNLPDCTLFWGRLTPDGSLPVSQEMAFRIALAAHRSQKWNAKRGKPRNGDINGFIRKLADSEMIYPELKEMFSRFNRRTTIASVEKVLVKEAGKLPFYDELLPYGVRATERLPFDCMVWFTLTAK